MGGKQKKISERASNQVMGFKVSQKPVVGFDLMQNCDLPPPSKVFLGSDKTVILSMNRVCNISGRAKEQDSKQHGDYLLENGDEEKDKRELLKALKASQTRAREAEKMAAILNKEKDGLSVALLEEAMQLFAYRQRVRLLELEVLNLQQKPAMLMPAEGAIGLPNEETTSVKWVLALIFSLGIGVATALAWCYT
ncbi:uncharacterized protein LOC131661478 [Vicia villosa]|uniref:uncharacterized protein LOC131661478 n=1 Tax=Vicia villosa TaxID=3911 RepID=UPI00273AB4E5|nr:uncharacterized protein LOC131661478 [Vicia villosa]